MTAKLIRFYFLYENLEKIILLSVKSLLCHVTTQAISCHFPYFNVQTDIILSEVNIFLYNAGFFQTIFFLS